MEPIEVTQAAVGEHVKGIAERLSVNKSWIYRICGQPEHDPYTRFLDLLWATAQENPAGADLYAADFQARYEAMRKPGPGISLGDSVAEALTAIGELVKDGPDFEARAAKAVRAIQDLMRAKAQRANQ